MFKPHHLYVIPAIVALSLSYLAVSSIEPGSGDPTNTWFGVMSFFSGIAGVLFSIFTFAGHGPYDTGPSIEDYD